MKMKRRDNLQNNHFYWPTIIITNSFCIASSPEIKTRKRSSKAYFQICQINILSGLLFILNYRKHMITVDASWVVGWKWIYNGHITSPHHFRSEHFYLHLYKSSTFTLRKICSLFSHLGVSISDWSFCCCVGTLCTSGLWRETCLQKTMGCFPPPLDTAEGLLPLSRHYIHP